MERKLANKIMDIVQHHEPIDFEALFRQAENATVGIDGHDLELFGLDADEFHSFFGSAELNDRLENAIESAIGTDDAVGIMRRCDSFMIFIKYNPNSKHPVKLKEMSSINDFIGGLPAESDITWSLMQDLAIGERIEFILICCHKK